MKLRRTCSTAIALATAFTLLGFSPPSGAAEREWRAPAIGGEGPHSIRGECPRFSYLAGLDLRGGHDIDAVGAICREWRADGTPGALSNLPVAGGPSGYPERYLCPESEPYVRRLQIGARGTTLVVGRIQMWCAPMEGPESTPIDSYNYFHFQGITFDRNRAQFEEILQPPAQQCPRAMAMAGIHGTYGDLVDELGVICRRREPLRRVATIGKRPEPPPTLNGEVTQRAEIEAASARAPATNGAIVATAAENPAARATARTQPTVPRESAGGGGAGTPTPADSRGIIIVGGKPAVPTQSTQAVQRPQTTIFSPANSARTAPGQKTNSPIQARTAATDAESAAHSIKTERLICRGGSTLGIHPASGIDPLPNVKGGPVVTHLYFLPAWSSAGTQVAPGAFGERLKPGTCAFESNLPRYEGPSGIRFQTMAPGVASPESAVKRERGGSAPASGVLVRTDMASVSAYLMNSRHFWRFDVYDSRYGHFQAMDHGIWIPPARSDVRIQGESRTRNALDAGQPR
jgi:hypothetical protein